VLKTEVSRYPPPSFPASISTEIHDWCARSHRRRDRRLPVLRGRPAPAPCRFPDADDADDDAAIDAARRDALASIERAATAEPLMAQLQASADNANSKITAIGAYIDQFVPALTEVQVAADDEALAFTEPLNSGDFEN